MQMTDSEICRSWRNSGGGKKQIRVLAELNSVSRETMAAKLRELKLLDSEDAAGMDFGNAAMTLYEEGLTDREIADALGRKDVSSVDVAAWRRDAGLPAHRKKRAERAHPGQTDREMKTAALNKILTEAVKRCPSGVLRVEGRKVLGVECRSRFEADGKEQVAVELILEQARAGEEADHEED